MKILVIGGVAAGTKAAAKLKRENRSLDVKIITKSEDISYAGCGLPYYVGGLIPDKDGLIVNTPAKYSGLTGVDVVTGCEAVNVDTDKKIVTCKNVATGEAVEEVYDKLIVSVGAEPFVPSVEGINLAGVFKVRTPEDAITMRDYLKDNNCKRAVVAGAGFIGLEVAENLKAQGLDVTVIDMASQIMPNILDREMADFAKKKIREAGIRIMTGTGLEAITGEGKVEGVTTSAGAMKADLAVLAIGVRPATKFLENTEIQMDKGTVVVNAHMETNVADVYAAGDCACVYNAITEKPQWSAMGSTANITGRCLAKTIAGKSTLYGGCLGTGVVKLMDNLNAGRTGLTEQQAKDAGMNPVTVVCITDDKAHYYPDSDSFITKLIADADSHKLLGIQVIGAGAVDKMVDIAVTGISAGMKIEDFNTLDYAYAPPFSTAIHPFVQACYILENKMAGEFETMTPAEYAEGKAKGYRVIDAQPAAKIQGAMWVNLSKVDGELEGVAQDEKLLLVCAKGKRGYFLQNRLKFYGYTNTLVLEGGATFNDVKVEGVEFTVSDLEIKRVKGLGCLQDKTRKDTFNVRVITRNGKLTNDEQVAVAEAAEKFGNGEVTMTTRLTLEIQAVPYENLEGIIDFLANAGLETGGTGSKVRPVVSCKGTTCQYGLIDSFAFSEKIHERFYKGYHGVTLPHKFKIAVGGCPNNCVKPNLNDVGVVGQRIPVLDMDKCKGCKKCQVEKGCPIKIAKVEEGKIVINPNECNHCGRCVGKCPFGVIDHFKSGYKIYIGGRWGKKTVHGVELDRIFETEQEAFDIIEKTILFFRDEGITGERLSDTVERLGLNYVQEKLYSDELLKKKEENLNKVVKGGATC